MVMLRAASKLERAVLCALCPNVATDAFLDGCRVEPLNTDQSILDVYGPSEQALGSNVIELGQGFFKGTAGEIVAFVLLLGDEYGNPRQLDFHGLADGMSMVDLEVHQFVAL
jgi:hypothetical protein